LLSFLQINRNLIRALVLCGITVAPVQAQTTGFLHGLVSSDKGDPLPGVVILVRSGGEGVAGRGAVTDKSGTFQIAGMPPAHDYSVRASLPGFATVTLSEVEVSAGEVSRIRITLSPETALREHVEVRAKPGMIDLAETTMSTQITSEFIDALPLFGRNYQEVLTLAPGVSDVDGDGNPNIHGARDTDMITLVDGVSTTDPLTGKAGAQLNLESIQEIEIKTSGATAEFSRAQGGFANIITKSGGNEFDGAFKMFWRGSLIDGDGAGVDDARLHAGVGEVGLRDLRFNDYLPFLSLGGPLVKDRAWFFVTSEYIQKQDPVNALSSSFVRELREYRQFLKLTWQATGTQRLALSVNYDPQEFLNEGLNGFTRQESGYSTKAGGTVVTLKGTSILSPMVALESSLSSFDGRPALVPNLGRDTNGNGILSYDRNGNGFADASERDPGSDYDQDGAWDVFEDINHNHRLDPGEDRDGDGRLTPDFACEGDTREDADCDGHLDNVFEADGPYGFISCFCEYNTDLDHDRRQDPGTEDRNNNRILDDAVRPTGIYPYGSLLPVLPDRDYSYGQSIGIISGPYYKDLDDRRKRVTLRQDLSVYVPEASGSHDVKVGWSFEREQFKRTTKAGDIIATIDDVCGGQATVSVDDPAWVCISTYLPTVKALLPTESSVDNKATGMTGGLYVQDGFKPLPNLSLGFGLRFDRERTDSFGYTSFDPAAQRAPFDRISSLMGAEKKLDDFLQGNNDKLRNFGILADPIFQGSTSPEQATAYLTDPMHLAAAGRLTRHHSETSFLSSRLAVLFPEIFSGGEMDLQQLHALGIFPQLRESFAITNNNLAPRLSVSWDPLADGRTKLFATWGRYYDKLFLGTIVGEEGPDYLGRYYDFSPSGVAVQYSPYPIANPTVIGGVPNHYIGRFLSKSAPSATQVDRSLRTPFSDELTLGFEREIAPEIALSVSYISRSYRDQIQDIDVNHSLRIDERTGEPFDDFGQMTVLPDGSRRPIRDGRPDLFLLNPFFNQVLRIGNSNEARYKGIEVALKKRLSRRWQMQGSYTYSRAIGAAEDFQSRLGNDPSTVESEFGYLDYDQRHVVKLFATTYLPHDWQVGSSVTWASGLPYSIVSRFFALDNEGYQQFRTRFGYTAIDPVSGPRFMQTARNSGRNESTLDLNLNLKKSFVMGRTSAAAVFEVFNVLNTDDLRVFTYEPNKGEFKPGEGILLATPLQLDAERKFGRRFQVGLQLEF
jgi:hypothetical protein